MVWPTDRLTRFEVARLVGARALQVSLGAPVLVKVEESLSPIDTAKAEFKEKIIPITVKRTMPNNEQVVIVINKAIDNWLKNHAGEI